MKRYAVALAVVALFASGCSSTKVEPVAKVENKLEQKPDLAKAEAEFLESFGTLQLQFSEDGQWILINTTGTAPINFNHAQGREDAFLLATMRAKRNVVEFLNNDLRSSKMTDNLTQTALRDIVKSNTNESRKRDSTKKNEDSLFNDGDETSGGNFSEEERQRANKIAQTVRESINDNANYLLRGAYVSKRSVDRENNMVAVQITISRKSINSAAQVRTMMNGL